MISYVIRVVVPVIFLLFAMAENGPAMAENGGPVPPPDTPKEQGSQSGLPLSYYCNSVPDLGIDRRDAVDNWVKICTVYFRAHPNQPEPPQRPKGLPKGRQNHPPRK